ncbi:cation diffusion facilitator family transporter [Brevibacillus centrosporus]|uniref:cation diffusion facilitator family transporter n=1 Tax=Brevibacillus TaxID=55080 RepID=UPI0039885DB6
MGKPTNSAIIAAWAGLISNIILTVIKLFVGLYYGSKVLLADGIHNAGDVFASVAAFSAMRISKKPADEKHPYGHGKAEVIASGIVAVVLAVAAIVIAYHSVHTLFSPAPGANVIALIAALVSLIWKQILFKYTIKIGKEQNSKGLIATAYDHLADVYASQAAVIGIGLGYIGELKNIPLLAYGDPFAGIVVSLIVLKLAYKMGRESIDTLMEKTVDSSKIQEFTELIFSVPEVMRIDRLRAREHGHYILVDVRASVSGALTVKEGHDISRLIKQRIMEYHKDVDEVLVHINPWYEENESTEKQ